MLITSSTLVLLVVGVDPQEDPNLDPPWSQNKWGIELKIARIN